jgi:hypothetical protein
MNGDLALRDLERKVASGDIDPSSVSGRQEQLENLVNRTLWKAVESGGRTPEPPAPRSSR